MNACPVLEGLIELVQAIDQEPSNAHELISGPKVKRNSCRVSSDPMHEGVTNGHTVCLLRTRAKMNVSVMNQSPRESTDGKDS